MWSSRNGQKSDVFFIKISYFEVHFYYFDRNCLYKPSKKASDSGQFVHKFSRDISRNTRIVIKTKYILYGR